MTMATLLGAGIARTAEFIKKDDKVLTGDVGLGSRIPTYSTIYIFYTRVGYAIAQGSQAAL